MHGATEAVHDKITQASGSFTQTLTGIKRLLKMGKHIEIRVVVSKLNINEFYSIAELIVQELNQIEYVSIIALEMTGCARKNKDMVWIPYKESFEHISEGIMYMIKHGINVKLYNFPLCTVDKKFWTITEKSISPYKVRFSQECEKCKMQNACGGVFSGTISIEKEELKAII